MADPYTFTFVCQPITAAHRYFRLLMRIALAIVFLALPSYGIFAQQEFGQRIPTQSSGGDSQFMPGAQQPKHILMASENVLVGTINKDNDRYHIVLEHGSVMFPLKEIRYIGDSMDDVFRYKQSLTRPNNIADLLGLARWCIKNNLFAEAVQQIEAARAIKPGDEDIEVVARTLESRLQTAQSNVNRPTEGGTSTSGAGGVVTAVVHTDTSTGGTSADEKQMLLPDELDKLLGNLPEGSVGAFAQSVQPFLLSNCALSDCHGPNSNNDFRLQQPSQGGRYSQGLTQQNLYATLRWISPKGVESSPLLTEPIKAGHGGRPEPVLTQKHIQQYKLCAFWVKQISAPSNTLSPLSVIGYKGIQSPVSKPIVNNTGNMAKEEETASIPSLRDSPFYNNRLPQSPPPALTSSQPETAVSPEGAAGSLTTAQRDALANSNAVPSPASRMLEKLRKDGTLSDPMLPEFGPRTNLQANTATMQQNAEYHSPIGDQMIPPMHRDAAVNGFNGQPYQQQFAGGNPTGSTPAAQQTPGAMPREYPDRSNMQTAPNHGGVWQGWSYAQSNPLPPSQADQPSGGIRGARFDDPQVQRGAWSNQVQQAGFTGTSPENTDPRLHGESVHMPKIPVEFQPADPFDPAIFNRQFHPDAKP